MSTTLMSLDDAALHSIISVIPSQIRRQLRCVSKRLRDLVDENWTEIRLGFDMGVDKSILERLEHYPQIKVLEIYVLLQPSAAVLFSAGWELETVKFVCSYVDRAAAFCNSDEASAIPKVFRSVRHLTLWGKVDVGPATLGAIGIVFPFLESLNFYKTPREKIALQSSVDFIVALAGPRAGTLSRLRKISFDDLKWPVIPLHNFTGIDWKLLEDLHLYSYGSDGPVSLLFGPSAEWPRLKVVKLMSNITTGNDLERLFAAKMPNIEVARLDGSSIFDPGPGPGAGAIMTRCAAAWPRLRDLTLVNLIRSNEDIEAFMGVTLPHLEAMDLGGSLFENLRVFRANAHRWPSLKSLSCAVLSDEDDVLLFLNNLTWKLESLSLIWNVSALGVLGTPPGAALQATLRTLHLETGDREDLTTNLFEGNWPVLEEIWLSGFHITVAAGAALSAAARDARLPALRKLDLSGARFDDGAIASLCTSRFEELEDLGLVADMGAGGGTVLAQSVASFPKLSVLRIPNLPSNELEQILRAPWPICLRKVYSRSPTLTIMYLLNDIEDPRWELFYTDTRYGYCFEYLRRVY